MKKLIVASSLFISLNVICQGVHFGFGSGTQWLKLEGGYSLSENLHLGAYYAPGFTVLSEGGVPSSYGLYGRYNFDDNEFGGGFLVASFRGYLGADVGLIHAKGYQAYNENYKLVNVESQTTVGFSAFGGGEILYGSKGKFGSFFELHIGRVSNVFNSLLSMYDTDVRLTSLWGLNVGLRMYLFR
jgi:hypothetical protein